MVYSKRIMFEQEQKKTKKDNPKLSGCDEDSNCQSINAGYVCNNFHSGIHLETGKHAGLCVPKSCDAEKKCPDFGSLHSGLLTGRCQPDNTCLYGGALIIA